MIAANDITAVFLTIPLIFYLNRKNKAFWCGVGQLVAGLANFLPLLAFLVVPGSYVKSTITEDEDVELCSKTDTQAEDDCDAGGLHDVGSDWAKVLALGCFFVCKLCSGVAQQAGRVLVGSFTKKYFSFLDLPPEHPLSTGLLDPRPRDDSPLILIEKNYFFFNESIQRLSL